MSAIKAFLEDISEQIGFEGEINDVVIERAQEILDHLDYISTPDQGRMFYGRFRRAGVVSSFALSAESEDEVREKILELGDVEWVVVYKDGRLR